MTISWEINIIDLILQLPAQSDQDIYQDAVFRRVCRQADWGTGIVAEVIIDSQIDTGINFHTITFTFNQTSTVALLCHSAKFQKSNGGFFVRPPNREVLLWFPGPVARRQYDFQNNIIFEEFQAFHPPDGVNDSILTIAGHPEIKVEFPVLVIKDRRESFLDEVSSSEFPEIQPVGLGLFFDYRSLHHAWPFFVGGKIYHPREKRMRFRWPCEQCAQVLYSHLKYLENQTAKRIYFFLRTVIAYSVALSLPADGRWRHGLWTDIRETHLRQQLDGVLLLLDYYQETQQALFLEKAQSALDYILKLADPWSEDRVWFLHDSLEHNENDFRLHYRDDFESQAFGKAIPNTLCLNTHAWTLVILAKLNSLIANDQYRDYYQKGIAALKTVLSSNDGEFKYRFFYGIRDCLIHRLARKESNFCLRLKQKYDQILNERVLSPLKKKHPRLALPNGYIERDLTHSTLSDFYHMQNMKDLLLLYRNEPRPWLRHIIQKSVNYSHRKGLIKYLVRYQEIRVIMFIEILLLYGSMIDENGIQWIVEYLRLFQENKLPLSVDARSPVLLTESTALFQADNPNVFILPAPGSPKVAAYVINPGNQDQKFRLHGANNLSLKEYKLIDRDNRIKAPNGELKVVQNSFLKIVTW